MRVKSKKKKNMFLGRFSSALIIGGIILLVLIFYSSVFQEARYAIRNTKDRENKEISPVDTSFGIVIPKINANTKIFPNIDPFNEKKFQPVLKKGVAHAKGTSFPGQGKNIYLFAHSTDAFYNVGRYNAVFYLLNKLEKGDKIDIYYNSKAYYYFVFEKKVIEADQVEYLKPSEGEILILQTCYPPGTTLKRLIVKARLMSDYFKKLDSF